MTIYITYTRIVFVIMLKVLFTFFIFLFVFVLVNQKKSQYLQVIYIGLIINKFTKQNKAITIK